MRSVALLTAVTAVQHNYFSSNGPDSNPDHYSPSPAVLLPLMVLVHLRVIDGAVNLGDLNPITR